MAFDFQWACFLYFLWEVTFLQARLDLTLQK
jgi:hypothetical protein